MFLTYIKKFLTKKIVNKLLSNVKFISSVPKIKTVGIVFDQNIFQESDALVQELVNQGIEKEDVKIIVFKETLKKNEVFAYPVFCNNDLSWAATFGKLEILDFIDEKFDLLINYYDIEKTPLLLLSNNSKASFKVGFSSIDKRLNHFMIDTNIEKHTVFTDELFKYLKILKKL